MNLRAITPVAGIPLMKWTEKDGKPEIDKVGTSRSAARLASVPKDQFTPWLIASEAATGTKIEVAQYSSGGLDALFALVETGDDIQSAMTPSKLALFLTDRMTIFYQDDKFQSQAFDRLLHRLNSLKPDVVRAWKTDLDKTLGKDVNLVVIACIIVTADQLFADEQYSSKQAEIYLRRLRQVPAGEAVSQWLKQVDQYHGTALDAALNIILTDGFFPAEKFDRDAFTQAIKETK